MPVLGLRARRFSEMNQVTIGVIALVVLTLLVTAALGLTSITRAISGGQYTAEFAQASGLRAGDEVQVSGLKVGTVEEVELDGTRVRVTFNAADVDLGRESEAAIKTANAVGNRYLSITPAGSGDLDAIPLARTSVPYDLNSALSDLTETSAELDVDQLAASMDALSETLHDTPDEFGGALDGLTRLSTAIASRDAELGRLLRRADNVSGVLADRSDQIVRLMGNGNKIFAELTARREVIHRLLVDARSLTTELRGFIEDNRATVGPTLASLERTTDLLQRNDESIAFMLKRLAPFARNLGEAVGSAPGFLAFIQNIPPTQIIPAVPGLVDGVTSPLLPRQRPSADGGR